MDSEHRKSRSETAAAIAADSSILEGLKGSLEDQEFMMSIVMWAWEHSEKFPHASPSTWEHPLEFTDLHNRYRQMFEDRSAEFLRDAGLDEKHVLETIVRELEVAESGQSRALLDSLIASEDYMSFIKFMQSVRTRRDWAEGKMIQSGVTIDGVSIAED